MSATLRQTEKREMIDKANSAIVLCLGIAFLGMLRWKLRRHRCGKS